MIVNPRLCCGKTCLRTMNIDILIFMIIIMIILIFMVIIMIVLIFTIITMIVLIFMVVSGQTRPPPI